MERGGAGLEVKRGGTADLWLMEKLRAGVGTRLGCLRKGDSGRGSEGRRDLSLERGLGGRAPGPMDWENLGIAAAGGV